MDVAQPVVSGVTATVLDAQAPGGEVELVVDHHDVVERQLVEPHGGADRVARLVHVCGGLEH